MLINSIPTQVYDSTSRGLEAQLEGEKIAWKSRGKTLDATQDSIFFLDN
jgi:hypothetical protein